MITNMTDILDEGIRQRCIWIQNNDFFFDYTYHYDKFCLMPSNQFEDLNLTECAKRAFESAKEVTEKKTPYSWNDVESCYTKSFKDITNKTMSAVPILDEQKVATGILTIFEVIPALVIEDYLVRGNLDSMSMASSICDSLENPPVAICNNLPDLIDKINQKIQDPYSKVPQNPNLEYTPEEDRVSFSQVFLGLVILIGSLVLIVACAVMAKKLLDKNLYRHINTEVEQNVQAYIRMRNEETTNKSPQATVDV